MKRVLLILPFLFLFQAAFAVKSYDSLLTRLNSVLAEKKSFDNEKVKWIEKLEKILSESNPADLKARYSIYLQH